MAPPCLRRQRSDHPENETVVRERVKRSISSASDPYVPFLLCWAQVAAEQPTALLNTGHRIPLLGLGTFKADEKTTNEAVAAALKAGYRSVWTK